MKTALAFILLALLAAACGKDTEESSHALVEQKPTSPLLSQDISANELISRAVEGNDAEATEAAIAKDANLNLMLPHGATLLTHALAHGFNKVVEILLAAGADEGKQDRQGKIPALLAMQLHRPQLVKLLITHGAELDTVDSAGNSLLMLAIQQEEEELARWLVHQGAGLEVVNLEGQTAAQLAKTTGFLRLVKLIDRRIDLLTGGTSEALIHKILLESDVEALRLALQKSPTILRTIVPTSALSLAIQGELPDKIAEMVQVILDQEMPVDGNPTDVRSPLSEAAARDLVDVVELLVKKGAALETKDELGWTALIHAVRANNPAALNELMNRGALKRYPYIMNGRLVYLDACQFAREVSTSTAEAKERLSQIKQKLKCSGRSFLFF